MDPNSAFDMAADKLPISNQTTTNGASYRLPLHRAPLRAKTGCLKCRKRRKKCDEVKPTCGDCTRLHFVCVWPDGTSSTKSANARPAAGTVASNEARSVLPSSSSSSNGSLPSLTVMSSDTLGTLVRRHSDTTSSSSDIELSEGFRLIADLHGGRSSPEPVSWPQVTTGFCQQPSSTMRTRNESEHSLLDKSPIILNLLICPTAEQACRDFSGILGIAQEQSWIRDSMLAFAASVMASSTPPGPLHLTACDLYQKAIVGLRRNFVDLGSLRKQQMLLVSVNFLGLLETLTSLEPERAMMHFVAAAKLLSILKPKNMWNMSTATQTFYRIMAEDALYNISCLAIFHRDLDSLAQQISWDDMESYFPMIQNSDGTYTSSYYYTSPFLGGRRDIYYLIFDVLHFARQDFSEPKKRDMVAKFREQLHLIEVGINSYYDDNVPAEVGAKYSDKYKLHAMCLRIIILKIECHGRCSASSEIAAVVGECLIFLKERDLLEHLNPALCWTMGILGFAVYTDEDYEIVRSFSDSLRAIIDKGHGDRLSMTLKAAERVRGSGPGRCLRSEHGSCIRAHDGLGLLMKKDGILA